MIQGSFDQQLFHETHISPSQNGFVRAVYYAYSHHHHLTLRPEDIWFAVLTQLSFFVNAHAEELRSFFVAHKGRKELGVLKLGTSQSADFGEIALCMTRLIEKNVVDPELRNWIIPNFSTTTESDKIVTAIVMMGALQQYFSYEVDLECGIPTVTLLGEREDWKIILNKLEKLLQLGKEPAQFVELLRPVLRRFLASFDDPTNPDILDFWGKCVHEIAGESGPNYLSGWITAFCFWKDEGSLLYGDGPLPPVSLDEWDEGNAGCELDDILFHKVDTKDIPSAFASVPVTVNDNGSTYESMMIAGLVGIQATPNGSVFNKNHDRHESDEQRPNSIQPLSGWWVYEKELPEASESREMEKKEIKDELATMRSRDYETMDWDHQMKLYSRLDELLNY